MHIDHTNAYLIHRQNYQKLIHIHKEQVKAFADMRPASITQQ